jgi:hypothetical protein
MQASLIASLEPAEEAERARDTILALLDRLERAMEFERPIDFGPAGESAYTDAMDLLREHEAAGLLDAETAVGRSLRLNARFDPAHAMALRRPFLGWVLAVSSRVLGEEHPDTLTSMNDLAETLRAQGDLPGARALQEQVRELRAVEHIELCRDQLAREDQARIRGRGAAE